ncbi:LCP family protein [Modestobacter sp. VKM Ac-2985]|uniref:LCP family protein n=1 Tax=Modestobacter sp. VKM Ac-2985 TaxID=3004139 RepID=UPI0022AB5613|nr:LCP family protein [Modestobacter sp. VKM Ac-2985]MCZ2837911.1 LCP family protein [Modestobacter sp. VKM Ac-2985]
MSDEPATRQGGRHGRRRGPHTVRGFGPALLFTVVGALVPGSAFLATGRRRLGAVVVVVFMVLLGGVAYLATTGLRDVIAVAVDSTALRWVIGGIVALAVAWLLVVLIGYALLLPRRTRAWQHVLGAVVVLTLCAGVVMPAVWAVRIADAQAQLLDNVFADRESATVTDSSDDPDPFGDREEVNFLLLGGDGGEGREGVRTDTVIVANVQTDTGATTLFSLPRNLQELPFPEDSPLGEVYPDGFDAGSEAESILNAVYRNGPAWYPDVLGPTDDPGADFLKLGVGEALGLEIDYFVLVNLDGFSRLVDALGGIDVNVNYYVPIGGEPTLGILPDDYIAPGPDQHMDGTRALDYARGRFGLSDYQRMDRQRCVIGAIVDAANPVTLLTRFQQLAATTQDIVSTDVPQSRLDELVDLAFEVKDAEIRSVVFDDTVIDPAYPDYDRIRALVQQALDGPSDTPSADTSSPADEPADEPAESEPADDASATSSPGATSAAPPEPDPAAEVGDACAYDPAQAQAARAEGEPPTRNG